MKKLVRNGNSVATDDDGSPILASRIERDGNAITGYDADGVEIFVLREIDPNVALTIVDETGAEVGFDAAPEDEFRKAIEAATSVADLKAALLGTSGPGAEPRHKR